MLISLVLGFKDCGKAFHGYIFEGSFFRGKNKIKKGMGLNTGRRGFIFGILLYIMILLFLLETIYFDNSECCYIYIFLYKCILLSAAEGIK